MAIARWWRSQDDHGNKIAHHTTMAVTRFANTGANTSQDVKCSHCITGTSIHDTPPQLTNHTPVIWRCAIPKYISPMHEASGWCMYIPERNTKRCVDVFDVLQYSRNSAQRLIHHHHDSITAYLPPMHQTDLTDTSYVNKLNVSWK